MMIRDGRRLTSSEPRETGMGRCGSALRPAGKWSRRILSLFVALLGLLAHGVNGRCEDTLHIGFSMTTLGEVNENDAIAAVRVWAQAIAKERDIQADPQPQIFRGTEEIAAALANKRVDCINLSTSEYVALKGLVAQDSVVVGVKSNTFTEEYVLLVHQASGIEKVKDLRGRTLGVLHSSRTSLAAAWLEHLLRGEGVGAADTFFPKIQQGTKIGKVVLPVFFRQMDACLITRSGLEIMIELNPQIGQQIKVLTSSPPVVPVLFCFRADYSSPLQAKLKSEISRWHLSPSGRQILTLFQVDRLEEQSAGCLNSALELLKTPSRPVNPPKGNSMGKESPN